MHPQRQRRDPRVDEHVDDVADHHHRQRDQQQSLRERSTLAAGRHDLHHDRDHEHRHRRVAHEHEADLQRRVLVLQAPARSGTTRRRRARRAPRAARPAASRSRPAPRRARAKPRSPSPSSTYPGSVSASGTMRPRRGQVAERVQALTSGAAGHEQDEADHDHDERPTMARPERSARRSRSRPSTRASAGRTCTARATPAARWRGPRSRLRPRPRRPRRTSVLSRPAPPARFGISYPSVGDARVLRPTRREPPNWEIRHAHTGRRAPRPGWERAVARGTFDLMQWADRLSPTPPDSR